MTVACNHIVRIERSQLPIWQWATFLLCDTGRGLESQSYWVCGSANLYVGDLPRQSLGSLPPASNKTLSCLAMVLVYCHCHSIRLCGRSQHSAVDPVHSSVCSLGCLRCSIARYTLLVTNRHSDKRIRQCRYVRSLKPLSSSCLNSCRHQYRHRSRLLSPPNHFPAQNEASNA